VNLMPEPNRDMWCDLCNEEPQVGITADGVAACTGCMLKVMDGIAEAVSSTPAFVPNRAMRRYARRSNSLRNDGTVKR
jgi:hypothetical protein